MEMLIRLLANPLSWVLVMVLISGFLCLKIDDSEDVSKR